MRSNASVEFLVLGPLAAVGPTGDVLSLGPPRRRASRVAPSATAFAQRAEQYDFLITSQWPDPRDSAPNVQWTQAFFAAMQPHLESAAYVNNLGVEGQERVRAAYGDNYPRLAELKRTYDPSNVFRLNQNIANHQDRHCL